MDSGVAYNELGPQWRGSLSLDHDMKREAYLRFPRENDMLACENEEALQDAEV